MAFAWLECVPVLIESNRFFKQFLYKISSISSNSKSFYTQPEHVYKHRRTFSTFFPTKIVFPHRFVAAFDQEIRCAIELALSARLTLATAQLSAYLQALPRFLPIDKVFAIDVTIAQDPLVCPALLSVGLRGQFRSRLQAAGDPILAHFTSPVVELPAGWVSGDDGSGKMVTIALCEDVVNSAADACVL